MTIAVYLDTDTGLLRVGTMRVRGKGRSCRMVSARIAARFPNLDMRRVSFAARQRSMGGWADGERVRADVMKGA